MTKCFLTSFRATMAHKIESFKIVREGMVERASVCKCVCMCVCVCVCVCVCARDRANV